MNGATVTNIIFFALTVSMLVCILILLLLFGEWTALNLLNVSLVVVVGGVGAIKRDRYGWYFLSIGTAIISISYFLSYCKNSGGYLGYIYAIAFVSSMFAFSYSLSTRFQERYGFH